MEHDSNVKGNVAELKIAAAATELGIPVLRPMTEHGRYDLVFEIEEDLLKVQCKWAARKDDVVVIHVSGNRLTPRGYIRSPYSAGEIDAVTAYCADLERVYLLPTELVLGKHQVRLRLAAAKNGQRAGLNWAADHELPGAVAQLGRASRWQREGRGFESHQLHSLESGAESVAGVETSVAGVETEVGAHEFRNHFGWYMQRATAGETFLVKRRGKPYVKLSPAAEPLTVVAFPKKRLAAG
jgi:PD-(D/E)XK endonuclease